MGTSIIAKTTGSIVELTSMKLLERKLSFPEVWPAVEDYKCMI